MPTPILPVHEIDPNETVPHRIVWDRVVEDTEPLWIRVLGLDPGTEDSPNYDGGLAVQYEDSSRASLALEQVWDDEGEPVEADNVYGWIEVGSDDLPAGEHKAEIVLVRTSGDVLTLPRRFPITLRVRRRAVPVDLI